ncbi:Ricin B-like lectins domain-containing protein [Dioscorea alata]|uniref:Ricin B-like lectins domain-containing protein n=1 Tax=Dioscorea alata TaxID=55571 RepID=A0ACB7W208_DIOAL|nr:Ricin B-like lectins domain-containing protein [Dioscorea alata]
MPRKALHLYFTLQRKRNMELRLNLLSLSLFFLLLHLHHQTSTAVLLLSDVQGKTRGVEENLDLGRPRKRILHPSNGLCVLRNYINDPLKLGPCAKSDSWNYTPQKFLQVQGTYFCLQAVGQGKPVRLSIICTPSDSSWQMLVSTSTSTSTSEKTHLATKLIDGTTLCLDVDSDNTIISNPCKDLNAAQASDFDTQWFTIISDQKSYLQIE